MLEWRSCVEFAGYWYLDLVPEMSKSIFDFCDTDFTGEIEQLFANRDFNFGGRSPVDIVHEAVFKAACGLHNGSTAQGIVLELGYVKPRKKDGYKLTTKGKAFLWRFLEVVMQLDVVLTEDVACATTTDGGASATTSSLYDLLEKVAPWIPVCKPGLHEEVQAALDAGLAGAGVQSAGEKPE